jgi:magnesium-transporting ATPase (P-type)
LTISPSPQPPLWHSLDTAQVLQALDTAPGGLSGAEAAHRLAAHGPNRLHPPAQRGPLLRFLLQFHNVIIYVLLASAAITAALGHWVDTGVILGVVFINALVGFVQEGKAESALAAIRKMLSLRALVLRDGQRREIAAEELVPGDWVLLQSGDKVPADLRLIDSKNLRIQEAVLTGEAEAVEKANAPVAADAAIGDRANMAYSGTWSATVRVRASSSQPASTPKSAASARCWSRSRKSPPPCCGRWPNSAAGLASPSCWSRWRPS